MAVWEIAAAAPELERQLRDVEPSEPAAESEAESQEGGEHGPVQDLCEGSSADLGHNPSASFDASDIVVNIPSTQSDISQGNSRRDEQLVRRVTGNVQRLFRC